MQKGLFYKNIEQDPRDSVLNDEKIDLKSIPGYQKLSSQKTMLSDDKVHVRAVNPKADKYITKMKQLAVLAKIRVADRKKKEEAGAPEASAPEASAPEANE